jgi:chitin disaccharide deacetylase
MKRLIVTADDFGLTHAITDGIVCAHREGILTHASIMPVGRAFAYAVEQARSCPGLGIGLHFTLVEERPLSSASTLVTNDGHFPKAYGALLKGVVLGRIRTQDIETELRAQVEACRAAGLELTHIDSHQHVHVLRSILHVVVKVARECGIPRVRLPIDSPWRTGVRTNPNFVAKAVLCGLARYGRRMTDSFVMCDRMFGLFESGALDEAALLRIIAVLPEGTTELITHPGFAEPLYAHWHYEWENELAALRSPRVRAALADVQLG